MSAEEVFRDSPRDLPYYLSFDVDCMSMTVAPETGMQGVGGIDYYQGLDLMDYATRELRLVGADFVEVSQGLLKLNMAARVVARYLSLFLFNRVPFQPIETYLYR
jgi:arginase family enzyme